MVMLKLKEDLYCEDNIIGCIRAYKSLAEIIYKKDADYWILSFKNCKYGEERTVKEFENYLIGLENK